jgi:hypothetical protein
VALDGGRLEMSTIENWTGGQSVMKSVGLQVVSYDGENWVFDSRYDQGVTARFQLHKTDENTFEGYSFVGGYEGDPNRWIRLR